MEEFMAKDGTNRGGARPNSGPQKKKSKPKLNDTAVTLNTDVELEGVDVPPIKDFLTSKQKNGKDLQAKEVYKAVYVWLKKRGCDKLVSQQLVEQYSMMVSRWIQCEEAISEYGFLAKHPTTGNAMQSPYVAMSQNYMKQINAVWFQIYQIVKDNGNADVEELDEQDIMMEALLKKKKK